MKASPEFALLLFGWDLVTRKVGKIIVKINKVGGKRKENSGEERKCLRHA